MLEKADSVAQDLSHPCRLSLVEHRPVGVVIGQVDRPVDAPGSPIVTALM